MIWIKLLDQNKKFSGHGADRYLYRRGRAARDSPLYILDYSWRARPGGWGRPGNVPRGNIFGRPPDHGRSRSRGRLGNGGSASQTPLPRHRVGRGDGYRPASRQGSGTSTRTRHHDPHDQRPARRRGKIQIRLALGHVSCILCAKYLRRTEGGDESTLPRDGRPWLLCGLPLGRLRSE